MKPITLLAALLLAACVPVDYNHYNDPEIVAKYFEQCLTLVPVGPTHVANNDWDEVVSECQYYAKSQAVQHQRVSKVPNAN